LSHKSNLSPVTKAPLECLELCADNGLYPVTKAAIASVRSPPIT